MGKSQGQLEILLCLSLMTINTVVFFLSPLYCRTLPTFARAIYKLFSHHTQLAFIITPSETNTCDCFSPGAGPFGTAAFDRPFCLALTRLTDLPDWQLLCGSAARHPRINTNNIQNTSALIYFSHTCVLPMRYLFTSEQNAIVLSIPFCVFFFNTLVIVRCCPASIYLKQGKHAVICTQI